MTAIYSSPTSRTLGTACSIAKEVGLSQVIGFKGQKGSTLPNKFIAKGCCFGSFGSFLKDVFIHVKFFSCCTISILVCVFGGSTLPFHSVPFRNRGPSLQVVPAYGLNCCAAAKMTGVGSRYFAREPEAEILGGVLAAPWPPLGDPKEVLPWHFWVG